jgi:hypothetical protein
MAAIQEGGGNQEGFERIGDDLATSLSKLGVIFARLGRLDDALPVDQEAVEIRRELVAAGRDWYRDDLAVSLSNLGLHLLGAGPSRRRPAGIPGGGGDPAGAGRGRRRILAEPADRPRSLPMVRMHQNTTSTTAVSRSAASRSLWPPASIFRRITRCSRRGLPSPIPRRPGRLAVQPQPRFLGAGPPV